MPYVQEAKEKIEYVKWRHRRYKKTQVKFLDIKTRKGGLLMIVTSFGIFVILP